MASRLLPRPLPTRFHYRSLSWFSSGEKYSRGHSIRQLAKRDSRRWRRQNRGSFPRFDRDDLLAAARRAMPAASILDSVWLDEYDSYYYGRSGTRPLPVLRVRYDDPDETWLYLDPYIGAIARKEVRLTRLNRWIYHGLHSLDFPFLYEQRPAWDIVVIGLSLGGLVLSATTLTQAGRRLRRHGRRALVVVKSRARQWRGPTS